MKRVTTGSVDTAGYAHVWRTLDNGGDQAFLEANCTVFQAFFVGTNAICGDCLLIEEGDCIAAGGSDGAHAEAMSTCEVAQALCSRLPSRQP